MFGSRPIVLEYDIDVFEVWPTGPCIGPLGTWIAARDRPLDVVSAYKLAELRALPGAMLFLSGGWLPRTISSTLEGWSLKYYVIDTRNAKVLEFFNDYLKGDGSSTSAETV